MRYMYASDFHIYTHGLYGSIKVQGKLQIFYAKCEISIHRNLISSQTQIKLKENKNRCPSIDLFLLLLLVFFLILLGRNKSNRIASSLIVVGKFELVINTCGCHASFSLLFIFILIRMHSISMSISISISIAFCIALDCIALDCISPFPFSAADQWSLLIDWRPRKLTTKQSRTDDPPSPSPFPFPFPFHWFSLRVFYSKHDLQLISNKLHWTKKHCTSSLN